MSRPAAAGRRGGTSRPITPAGTAALERRFGYQERTAATAATSSTINAPNGTTTRGGSARKNDTR